MIRRALKLDPRRTGPLDFGLTAFSTGLALYSLSMSIGSGSDALVLVGLSTAGMLFSFAVSRLAANTIAVKLDGLIYALLGVFAWLFRERLGTLLPDNLFVERAMIAAGGVCWILVLGSFVTWRDATLLFQTVPSLAIFGLVGCFDLFKDATFLFFIFLLCQATLMARAHGRLMMQQAERSGYSGAEHLTEGPWRWMAGPEWAMASALAIVLVSLLGAPAIQDSANSLHISGFVPKPAALSRLPAPALFTPNSAGGVFVGLGPNRLTNTPLFRAQMPWNYYMRSQGYYDYTGQGWQSYYDSSRLRTTLHGLKLSDYTAKVLENAPPHQFMVEELTPRPLPFLPVPGDVAEGPDISYYFNQTFDGSLVVQSANRTLPRIVGTYRVAPQNVQPRDRASDLDPAFNFLTDTTNIPRSVQELAQRVTVGATTDAEKAERIKHEIEHRCRYNLNAAATPPHTDPVENFLFKSHEGYCDLFATSMVTMARSVGLPARYVVGYLPDPQTEDGWYTVKESDSHAWAEICFHGVGWVTFDPTLGAEQAPDGRRGDVTDKSWFATPWFRYLAFPLGVLAAILFGIRSVQNRKSGKNRRTPRQEVGRVYAKFERLLTSAAGHPRRLSQTAGEFLHTSERRLGNQKKRARELNHRFEEALYGSTEPDMETVGVLKREVASLKSDLKRDLAAKESMGHRR